MHAIGFPGALASAAKIDSRCRFEDANDHLSKSNRKQKPI